MTYNILTCLRFGTTEEVGTFGSAGEAEDARIGGRRMAKQRLATCRGSSRKREPKPEPTEPRGSEAEKGKKGGRVEKDRASRVKAKTKTWADVVKGLKEEELEKTNLDKA